VAGTVTVDFTSVANVSEFSLTEYIELVKILLITLQEVDSFIAALLNPIAVIRQLAMKKFGETPVRINKFIVDERVRALINNARTQLQLTVTEAQCEPLAKTIGVK